MNPEHQPASASDEAWRRFCEEWRRADEALESLPYCSVSLTPWGLEIHRARFRSGRAVYIFLGLLVALGLAVALAPGVLGFLAPFVLVAGLMAYRDTFGARAERLMVDSDAVTVERLRKGKVDERVQFSVESMYLPTARVHREEFFQRALADDKLSEKEVREQMGQPGVHLCDVHGQRVVFGGDLAVRYEEPLMGTKNHQAEIEWLAAKIGAYLELMRGAYEPDAQVTVERAPAYAEVDAWLEEFDSPVPLEHQVRERLSNAETYDFLRPLYAGASIEAPADTAIERTEDRDSTRFELPRVGVRGSARRAVTTTLFSNLLMGGLLGFSTIAGVGILGPPWENFGAAWVVLSLFLAMLVALSAISVDQGRRALQAAFGRERIVLDASGLSFERSVLGWRSVDFIPVDKLEGVDVVADVYLGNNDGTHNVSSYALLVYSFDAEPLRVAPGRSKEDLLWLASQIRDFIEAENGAVGVEYVLDLSADEVEASAEVGSVNEETHEKVAAKETVGV
ncbi:hypothetical protein FIV42_17825 [Persicimonas caeni]|uniref:Uncharacterized protein n=1 Tax=Persicimonas caeni TaxID=2292766 RepID=A0A4Y6PXQ6_PERCE|nr:hypothetical protein [Persicimonas caeni]QDG52525.1 hypothetical protein FIV42_17825 [Persicimonas caeni]QED33747.1 hypothetical protein FRD00_17820 [Persicimonas caeni]